MKKITFILALFLSGLMQGQHLANFYLEPGQSDDSIRVHTEFHYSRSAGYIGHEVVYDGNTINFYLCYALGSLTIETYDIQDFDVALPVGYSGYTFNFSVASNGSPTDYCNFDELLFSESVDFPFPYNPTDTTAIPDANFEGFLEAQGFGDGIDNNELVFTHRIKHITWLRMDLYDLENLGLGQIDDLTGIKTMGRLRTLWANGHSFPSFDATMHPELYLLWIGEMLTDLDVSDNPMLEVLWVYSEKPLSIFPINSPLLRWVNLGGIGIENVDISQNMGLREFQLHNTSIASLDVSQSNPLEDINLRGNNSLLNVDMSLNENLINVRLQENGNLETLLLGNHPNMLRFICAENPLIELNLTQCPSIDFLRVIDNDQLELMDLSNNDLLTDVIILGNDNLTFIDLKTGGTGIQEAEIFSFDNGEPLCVQVDNELEAPYPSWSFPSETIFDEDCDAPEPITITDPNFLNALLNFNVVDLDLDGTGDVVADSNGDGLIQENEAESILGLVLPSLEIESLNGIGYFSNLTELIVDDNEIEQIDLSNNTNISWLSLNNNSLSNIDIGELDTIQRLWLNGNAITTLDVMQNTTLESFRCGDNELQSLLMNNNNNTNIVDFDASGNPNLFCIQVDDVDFAESNPNWMKDVTASYSLNCSLGSEDMGWRSLAFAPNPSRGKIQIQSAFPISKIEVFSTGGELLLSQEGSISEVDLMRLPSGIYFIKFYSRDYGSEAKKIIKY